jgi:predicted helicase
MTSPLQPNHFPTNSSEGFALQPHQGEAVAAINTALVGHNSVQFISACGTGKTTSMWQIAGTRDAAFIVYFVPSIGLINQAINEWSLRAGRTGLNIVAVCSRNDAGTAKLDADALETDVGEVLAVVHSDAESLALWAAEPTNMGTATKPTVIFSTYASSKHVVDAQHLWGMKDFDIAFGDEAHHLVGDGKNTPMGELVKDKADGADRLRAGKRVYATATPRSATAQIREAVEKASANSKIRKFYPDFMDADSDVYGPYAYTLSFGEAIARGILVDYRVSVMTATAVEAEQLHQSSSFIDENGNTVTPSMMVARQAIMLASRDLGAKRFITYQNRVADAAKLATFLNASDGVPGASHISGKHSTRDRQHSLSLLESEADGHIVTNVQCLSEGIDVPALDAVVFIDPKYGAIDIMQSIGRALRHSTDRSKTVGHIILVIVVPDGFNNTDLDEEGRQDFLKLHSGAFAPIMAVLDELEKHDSVVAEYMTRMRAYNKFVPGAAGTAGRVIGSPGEHHTTLAARAGFDMHFFDVNGRTPDQTRQLMESISLSAAREAKRKWEMMDDRWLLSSFIEQLVKDGLNYETAVRHIEDFSSTRINPIEAKNAMENAYRAENAPTIDKHAA